MNTASKGRTILHVDMDAFFAAVEVREDPTLKGKPVIIGSDPKKGTGRGVVSTASYEARRHGVHSAMPISQAYRCCPRAVFLRPRIKLYREVSSQIFNIFHNFSDQVEGLSLDEAFIDVTGSQKLFGTGPQIATRIKEQILTSEQLTASVGVGTNKYVAKVASDLDKPDGLTVVHGGMERDFLAPLEIGRLWGAGGKAQAKLRALGVKTIGDVANLNPTVLETALGQAMGRRFHELANGHDLRSVCTGKKQKSLGKEVTFLNDIDDRHQVETTLLDLCDTVAQNLRQKGLAGRTIHVKLRWEGFETHTRQRTLKRPAVTTEDIWPVARALFRESDDKSRRVRLIGVSLSKFKPVEADQLTFLNQEGASTKEIAGKHRLAESVDELSDRFGRRIITRAALLNSKIQE